METTIHLASVPRRAREAVLRVLECDALADTWTFADDVTVELVLPLSTGQQSLWRLALSIAGQGSVNLLDLLGRIDLPSRAAVREALHQAFAEAVPA
jgi:hypothetical protein